MVVTWMLLIAFGVLTQGRPQYFYGEQRDHDSNHPATARVSIAHAPQISVALCSLVSSTDHQVKGNVVLRQTNAEDPVEITGSISGLAPGYHGFHVHQNANLSDNCKAAGSHFNPENKSHGAPQDPDRHVGDLGNISADENGISAFQILDNQISLFEGHPKQVLGRAIVVHQKEDDLGKGGNEESKKTGNAGSRVACCIIEPSPYH